MGGSFKITTSLIKYLSLTTYQQIKKMSAHPKQPTTGRDIPQMIITINERFIKMCAKV